MTIAQLKQLAQETLDYGIAEIRESGSLSQSFYLVKRGGGMDFVLVDGSVTNDESSKSALAKQLKERVAEGEVEAVIMLSDVYWAELDPKADTIRKRFGMTVKEAQDAGLCESHEGVLVTLESPILQQLSRQEYRRDGNRIELVGNALVADNASGNDTGMRALPSRFMNYFPEKHAGQTQ